MSGMGTHQSAQMGKDEWLTPPGIIEALGEFDLDPCAPLADRKPWDTAKQHYTVEDNGLSKEWKGRVWCNPPYGRYAGAWLNKMSEHKHGIALIFARTETKMFFDFVWNCADSVFFFEGRLHFHHITGKVASANAGAPSCLVSYSPLDTLAIQNAVNSGDIKGVLIVL